MLTDKELDEIEARLAAASTIPFVSYEVRFVALLADAVTLLAEVRRIRPCPRSRYYGIGIGTKDAP